ncbi:unnamed protein product [Schistosoma bovis]|nr:unnamed protein product [Schistosoma bovis]
MTDSANKEAPSEHINIKVQGQEGSIIHFKIRKSTPFKKLITAYCDRLGVNQSAVRFFFDGNSVHETDTPGSKMIPLKFSRHKLVDLTFIDDDLSKFLLRISFNIIILEDILLRASNVARA